jgi:hypothetical protein
MPLLQRKSLLRVRMQLARWDAHALRFPHAVLDHLRQRRRWLLQVLPVLRLAQQQRPLHLPQQPADHMLRARPAQAVGFAVAAVALAADLAGGMAGLLLLSAIVVAIAQQTLP